MNLGVKALGTHPLKSEKRGLGDIQKVIRFGGVTFRPDEYLYADEDGVVVSERPL
jgi:regulator of ribonuclease activity A